MILNSNGNEFKNKKNKSSKNPSDVIERVDQIKIKENLIRTSENIEKRGNSLGLAFRLSTELVSGLVVGGVMGWSIDKWLGTKPWFLLIFFILGIAAGIINVIKTAKSMNNES